MFKFWSDSNIQLKKQLKPDLRLRSWDELSSDEKDKIWHYLEWYFFNESIMKSYDTFGDPIGRYYQFYGKSEREKDQKCKTVLHSIIYINENYKHRSYASEYLKNSSLNTACFDFHKIFKEENEMVVMELLSAYAKYFKEITRDDEFVFREKGENGIDFTKRKERAEFGYFEIFAKRLNDVFLQFGLNYYLTRRGFIPRQDTKIIEYAYEPILRGLADKKWTKVNEILSDAFLDYSKHTPQGYSSCVTNTISAIEAFLQILVEGKTGVTRLSKLIPIGQTKGLIPRDIFSSTIFNNIDSILARERKSTSTAHVKDDYATEKNAKTILNLA